LFILQENIEKPFWQMSEKTAIVVGAGIVGLATARALAKKGYRIKLFERTAAAVGASVRNFGMIWPIGQPSGKLYDRAIRSRGCWNEIAGPAGLWSDPVGSLHLAYHADEWVVLQELFELFRAAGRKVELLNKEQVRAKSTVAVTGNCMGGLFSAEELIIDPREAIAKLPAYLRESAGIEFHWGQAVTAISHPTVTAGGKQFKADLIFVCSGADFETLYPEAFAGFPLTRCKLQMMRMVQRDPTERIGPALCGGLSLIHYGSFKAAGSLALLRKRYEETMTDYIRWGIHVMLAQNESGEISIGDSHEYGPAPDPFDRRDINQKILHYLSTFAALKDPVLVQSWNGVYAKLTNGDTDLYFSPEPGVHVINAVSGAGMTLSFGLAEELMESILS
jgi:FAD dependent oxidoreductase TIGR03364